MSSRKARKFPTTFRPFSELRGLLVEEDTMDNLIVDDKRKHFKDGDTCPSCLEGKLTENHDNVECLDCKYVNFDECKLPRTRIYVRALYNSKWGSFDVAELNLKSLNTWIGTLTEDGKLRLIHLLLGHPQVEGEADV
jgi:hypothetical protein